MSTLKSSTTCTLLASTLFLGGCAGMSPDSLKRPSTLSCISVPQDLEVHDTKGIVGIEWTTKLVAGPYISEREDSEGVYYRAPSGGLYQAMTNHNNGIMPTTLDGGIWVPHDPAKPPHLYTYYSTQNAITAPLPPGASCENAFVTKDPQGEGVDKIAFATAGAIGGAAGGLAGRGIAQHSSMSYGQAAGAGVAAGAISGLIVASMINMDVGKIFVQPVSNNLDFVKKLSQLGSEAKPIQEVRAADVDAGSDQATNHNAAVAPGSSTGGGPESR